MTAKDYRFLMNGQRELAEEDLMELLKDNEIVNFDPVAEAFKVSAARLLYQFMRLVGSVPWHTISSHTPSPFSCFSLFV